MTTQIILSDGPVDVTHTWLHDSFVTALENGDLDAVQALNAIGLIAFGQKETAETQLGATRTVRMTTTWTPERLAALNALIVTLELEIAGLES